jgi:anti-sigma regulatory factor (Ser/Thr protein kinase)
MILPLYIHIEEPSQPGDARRVVTSLCHELGFNELRTAEVALVVTELATNLVKHTDHKGGYLVFTPIEVSGCIGIDILSLDQGGGIANIGECLRDGFSSTGTPGGGLGSIRRQSSVFDIFSVRDKGTGVFTRFWQKLPPESPPALEVGSVCLPLEGEQACGDAWAMKSGRDSTLFMLADGLGHGAAAAEASNQAVATFLQLAPRSPAELVYQIHSTLRYTRGAVLAVVEIAFGQFIVRYAGIGNISGRIYSQIDYINLTSNNGTAGVGVPNIKEFTYPWTKDGLLLMHSDGVAIHWSLEDYPGLSQKHPALIAGILFRDHQRLRDDSSILVVKSVERKFGL